MKTIRDVSKTIDVTSTVIAEFISDADTNSEAGNYRELIYLRNTSTAGESISISIGQEAVTGQGLILKPNDFVAFVMEGAYRPSSDRYTAIASAATATLAIHEELQQKVF